MAGDSLDEKEKCAMVDRMYSKYSRNIMFYVYILYSV
jgi:hypothetical protein